MMMNLARVKFGSSTHQDPNMTWANDDDDETGKQCWMDGRAGGLVTIFFQSCVVDIYFLLPHLPVSHMLPDSFVSPRHSRVQAPYFKKMRKMKLIYLSAGQLVHYYVTKARVKDQTSDSFWWPGAICRTFSNQNLRNCNPLFFYRTFSSMKILHAHIQQVCGFELMHYKHFYKENFSLDCSVNLSHFSFIRQYVHLLGVEIYILAKRDDDIL